MEMIKVTVPQDDSIEVEIEWDELPEAVKARLARMAVDKYIRNSTTSAEQKWKKAGEVAADKPDYAELAAAAKKRLVEGTMRAENGETNKAKKNPLEAFVSVAVIRDLMERKRKKNPKYSLTDARKEIGGSAIAYLEKLAGDDTDKIKAMDAKYLKPARLLAGVNAKGEKVAPKDDNEDDDDLI